MATPWSSVQKLLYRIPGLGRHKTLVLRFGSSFNMAQSCKAGRERFREIKPREHKKALAAEIRELFDNHAMVAVLSYFDMKNIEWTEFIYEGSKNDIHFRFLPNKIVHRALDNTAYINICPLFISTNVVAYSKDSQVKGLLDTLKNQRKVQLLGGKIDNRLFAVDGFNWLSKLPPLEQLHAELVSILAQPAQNIMQLLIKNQQTLSQNLEMLTSKNET